jgi:hypothetical protein
MRRAGLVGCGAGGQSHGPDRRAARAAGLGAVVARAPPGGGGPGPGGDAGGRRRVCLRCGAARGGVVRGAGGGGHGVAADGVAHFGGHRRRRTRLVAGRRGADTGARARVGPARRRPAGGGRRQWRAPVWEPGRHSGHGALGKTRSDGHLQGQFWLPSGPGLLRPRGWHRRGPRRPARPRERGGEHLQRPLRCVGCGAGRAAHPARRHPGGSARRQCLCHQRLPRPRRADRL